MCITYIIVCVSVHNLYTFVRMEALQPLEGRIQEQLEIMKMEPWLLDQRFFICFENRTQTPIMELSVLLKTMTSSHW